jgi:hypothetical protein
MIRVIAIPGEQGRRGELSRDGAAWEHELAIIYRRIG